MASAFPGQVSAVQVGSYFLGQYYPFLQQTPNLVHQFYTNESTMIRYDGETNESASGMATSNLTSQTNAENSKLIGKVKVEEPLAKKILIYGAFVHLCSCGFFFLAEIHNLIVRLNLTEIEIKTAHSLESWNGGVLVTVTGFMQAKDFIFRRKFVETFFLAPQEKGYFVLNDIFLLLEEEQVHQHQEVASMPNDYDTKLDELNLVQESVSSFTLGDDIPARDFISPPLLADDNNQMDNFNATGQSNQIPDPDERVDETLIELPSSVLSVPNVLQESFTPEDEPVEERPKHTYASVLRTAKAQVTQLISGSKTAPVLSDSNHAPQATPQYAQATISSLPENSTVELIDEVSAFDEEGDSKSVYVGNLPSSISTSDLEQEFRNFGKIKPDGVTIRSRKEAGVFYAFIEYEDAAGVQNALKASPVQLNGRLIHVEGRRPNSGVSRGGRRGRGGRGGYYSEVPRGRFTGRSFGGNDRDYTNRSRGNGYLQRLPVPLPLPRQERGILGSHFPKNGGSRSEALAS